MADCMKWRLPGIYSLQNTRVWRGRWTSKFIYCAFERGVRCWVLMWVLGLECVLGVFERGLSSEVRSLQRVSS